MLSGIYEYLNVDLFLYPVRKVSSISKFSNL